MCPTSRLIAIMLGRLRMSIDEAITAYKDLSPLIFKRKWWTQKQAAKYFGAEMQQYWFQGQNLVSAVEKLLEGMSMDRTSTLRESQAPACRV